MTNKVNYFSKDKINWKDQIIGELPKELKEGCGNLFNTSKKENIATICNSKHLCPSCSGESK